MKRKVALMLLIVLTVMLTGCWDAAEIEDLFLVWGMGWDIAEDPHLMTLTLVAPSTEQGAEEPVSILSTTGHSVAQARMNAQTHIYRKIQMGHLRILVIGEEMAREGIQKQLDTIGRNPRIGRDTLVVVFKGKAMELFNELEHPSNPISVQYLVDLLKTNYTFTRAAVTSFRDYFEALSQEGIEPITSYITIDESKSMVNAFAIAAFKEDKMVGILNDTEVQMFQIIRNKNENGSFTIGAATDEPDENAVTYAVRRGGTKVKTKVIDGKPHINLSVELEGDILEYTSLAPLANPKNIQTAEKNLEAQIKREMQKVVGKVQGELKSDIFGFGQYFKAYHYDYWKSVNWEEEFPNAEVDVQVVVNVRRIGIES